MSTTFTTGARHEIALEVDGSAAGMVIVEKVARLRRAIKYGVGEPRGAVICEELFDDRMVALRVLDVIGGDGGDEVEKVRSAMVRHRTEIEDLLTGFPSYYLAEFEKWVGGSRR